MPLGRWSVSGAVSVATALSPFVSWMVSTVFAPCFTELSLKDLLRVGLTHWAALTVSVDLVGAELLPLLVFNAPAGSEFT